MFKDGEMLKLLEMSTKKSVVIKVIGVGGGGCQAVQHMIEYGIEGVQYICVDSDEQMLSKMSAKPSIKISARSASEFNVRSEKEIRSKAILEDRGRIEKAIGDADMLFIIAGMGGVTGTSMAAIVAKIAESCGILTIALVTKPLSYEKNTNSFFAAQGVKKLSQYADTTILLPYEKLIVKKKNQLFVQKIFNQTSNILNEAFRTFSELIFHPIAFQRSFAYLRDSAFDPNSECLLPNNQHEASASNGSPNQDDFEVLNDHWLMLVENIADVINQPGLICIDYADVRTVLVKKGMAMIAFGEAKGENRAIEASLAALTSPLLKGANINNAKGLLIIVSAGFDISVNEIDQVVCYFEDVFSDATAIVIGTITDSDMTSMRISLVVTGLR